MDNTVQIHHTTGFLNVKWGQGILMTLLENV